MRLFVAIDLTEEVRTALAELLRRLRATTELVRWVKPASLHVTLKFIGETPEENLEPIAERLATVETSSPVELRFGRVGFFPHERQPRVFWVGIAATPNLAELVAQVETELAGLGISPEKRPLRPHLTLGRFRTPRRDPRLAQVVLDLADRELARQTVREFFLFQSRLSREGAEYSKLKRFEFARPRHGL